MRKNRAYWYLNLTKARLKETELLDEKYLKRETMILY
jgi:hypothetical protein